MKPTVNHPEFPEIAKVFAPRVHIPAICIPQHDGSVLVKPGKPQIVGDELRVAEFAKLTGLSMSRVEALCLEGEISSRRLTPKHKSPYLILRSELERYLNLRRINSRELLQ